MAISGFMQTKYDARWIMMQEDQHWNRLPREVVGIPSLSEAKRSLGNACNNMF